MSDKLSAASLLLAIVAVLYGMWYPQLTEALRTKVPEFSADRAKPRKEVAEVRKGRAFPLMVAAVGVGVVFLPDAVAIALQSLRIAASEGLGAVRDYDSVTTAFVLVEVVSLYFAIHFVGMWTEFGRLLKRLA
jgi:hypothetical protein